MAAIHFRFPACGRGKSKFPPENPNYIAKPAGACHTIVIPAGLPTATCGKNSK